MSLKMTLGQMKDLSIDEIIRLYQIGYTIEDNISLINLADPIVDPFVNFGKATVSTGYDDLTLIIVLNTGDGSIFPDPSTSGPFNLVWWNSTDYGDPSDDPNKEIVRCTDRSGDILTILRAQEGMAASIKNLPGKTYKVVLSVTAKAFTDLQNDAQSRVNTGIYTHSSLTSGIHGVTGNLVGTSDSQILTHKTITDSSNNITAKSLKSSTTTIDISTATAPTTGQILTATSPIAATWQSLQPPTCFFASILGSPTSGALPLAVNFNATVIGGVAPYTYSWTFGDGGISSNPAPSHNYTVSGIYTVGLIATDLTGNSATSATTITVLTGIGIVTSGLGMSESISLPESIIMYNSGPTVSDVISLPDSLAGINNTSTGAGSPMLESVTRQELLTFTNV